MVKVLVIFFMAISCAYATFCFDPNAYWSKCGDNNCGRLCSNYNTNVACPAVCRVGCSCKPGYVFDENANRCVLPTQCLSYCGGDPNAYWSKCGDNNCGRLCSNYDKGIACAAVCRVGCSCKRGYVYDENIKRCVVPKQCTPVCKKDEVYNSCINSGCVPRSCSQLGLPVPCVKIDPKYCIKGCVCAGDKLRAPNGICVPRKQCYSTYCAGDPNSYWSKCGDNNCGRLCSNYYKGIGCPLICRVGCSCKRGYVYDENTKRCVLPKQCSCGKYEVFSNCINDGCYRRYCSELYEPIKCPVPGGCIKGCICEPNYLRNYRGECVPINQCPKRCTGPNEYFACGGACDNVCATLKFQNQTNCPIINIKCNEKCYCEEGYARNLNNICIPIKDCKICRKDEIFSLCPPAACDADFCPLSRNDPQVCGSTKDCKPPRCVCPYNYRRDRKTKECIPITKCPPFKCTGKNEVYDPCPLPCPGDSCTKNIIICPLYKNLLCQPTCRCRKNFCRNNKGICVPKK